MRRLMAKLGLNAFINEGHLVGTEIRPTRVVLPLKQHAGAPAVAQVRPGTPVHVGDLIAAPPKDTLGARIHASINGIVRDVNGSVVIEGGE